MNDKALSPEMQEAYSQWTSKLLDLSRRNKLVHFSELRLGNIKLCGETPTDWLKVGRAESQKKSIDLKAAKGDIELDELSKKTQTIARKHISNLEERGTSTLKVISHTINLEIDKKDYEVPVFVQNLELPSAEQFANVAHLFLVEETLEINPSLQKLIAKLTDPKEVEAFFGELKETAKNWKETDILSNHENISALSQNILSFLEEARVGFIPVVTPQVQIGNFSYQGMPIAQDLEAACNKGISTDLVEALAGEEEARHKLATSGVIKSEPKSPDYVKPKNEFLVLDADSSQSRAINKALSGQSLVIQGPPGTGKSQTIANLVASFIAKNKTVLFVAEKKAAIEAVANRLEEVELGHLVLNLHGRAEDKKRLYGDIGSAMNKVGTSGKPPKVDDSLVEARGAVLRRFDFYKNPLPPWELSPYEVMSEIIKTQKVEEKFLPKMPRGLGDGLNKKVISDIEKTVREYQDLGGLDEKVRASPWNQFYLKDREGILIVKDVATDLLQVLVKTQEMFQQEDRASSSLKEFFYHVHNSIRYKILCDQLGYFLVQKEVLLFEKLKAVALGHADFQGSKIGVFEKRKLVKKALSLTPYKMDKGNLFVLLQNISALQAWKEQVWSRNFPYFIAQEAGDIIAYTSMLLGKLSEFFKLPGFYSQKSLVKFLEDILADLDPLGWNVPDIRRLEAKLDKLGARKALESLYADRVHPEKILPLLSLSLWKALEVSMVEKTPAITSLTAKALDSQVENYAKQDRHHIQKKAARISREAEKHFRSTAEEHYKQHEIVKSNVRKKRGQSPIRQLVRDAPDVMTALFPVWALSPLEVAQILPLEYKFDLVVFDEASQVQPHEAVSALLRGKQTVVAGDRWQLPPTAFFVSESPEEESTTSDYESLLDAMEGFLNSSLLSWHYRSQDERLIAVSNAHIYDNRLTTFPGAGGVEAIVFKEVLSKEGAVDSVNSLEKASSAEDESGVSGVSAEIKEVLDTIKNEIHKYPRHTLGVITFNVKHADLIEAAIDKDQELSETLASLDEPFFVKNIERVQGDERDTIIISTGYQKNINGTLSQNFGPINKEGGERRLNVMASRAKKKMILISSFNSGDINMQSKSKGVRVLRAFFDFFERGGVLVKSNTSTVPLNAFEADIKDKLTKRGLELISQYGCSSYRIDFAVVHPSRPGQFVLAIEADGASYHSTVSARDRDRLRQDHLERLGWKFHRIWSTAWFRNANEEVEKAYQAYRCALLEEDQPVAQSVIVDETEERSLPKERGPMPVTVSEPAQIDDYSSEQLERVAKWILSDERILTSAQVQEEMFKVLKFKIKGPKIQMRLKDAAISAIKDDN